MRVISFAGVVLALTLAACGSRGSYTEARVPPLQPVPVPPVAAQPLPPPTTDMALTTPPAGAPAPGAAQPATPDASQAVEVRKPDLSGGWTIASGGDSCQLFMSLTTWSGGYRANTRGCNSEELKSVGAWDLAGKEIVLKDAAGQPLARLLASSNTRFSGTSNSGQGVQVFR